MTNKTVEGDEYKYDEVLGNTLPSLMHRIVINTINGLAEMDSELYEIKQKYKIAVEFIKHIKDNTGCDLVSYECPSCKALDVLRELGEI